MTQSELKRLFWDFYLLFGPGFLVHLSLAMFATYEREEKVSLASFERLKQFCLASGFPKVFQTLKQFPVSLFEIQKYLKGELNDWGWGV